MAILFALSSNLVFAFASTLFADFSKLISGKWINCFKLLIAFICFGVSALVVRDGVSWVTIPYYLVTGAVGLFVADHFICNAFAKLGSARTLMIFSFSPLFVAGWSFLFLSEALGTKKFIAILFLMACVMTLSLEKFRKEGHWEVPGILMALLGVILDGLGNFITSYAFRMSPTDGIFTVCAIRALGALVLFLLCKPLLKIKVIQIFQKLPRQKKALAILASFIGTFMSLALWTMAVKFGNITTIVAIACATPLFAAIFEIFMGRTHLSKYLLAALTFFGCGFYFILLK